MRPGIDANAVLEAMVDERVNLKLRQLEELRFPRWMNETRAAEYLDISPKALGNARRAGKVQGHRVAGNGFTYAKAELDTFAEKS
jgi:hypothetical protein